MVSTRPVEAPDMHSSTSLGLIRRAGKIKVGDTQDHAFRIFKQPPTAYEFSDLPSVLSSEHFKAAGWQSTGSGQRPSEGFGVVLYDDQVCLAVYQIDHQTEEGVQELLTDHQKEVGTTPTSTQLGKYIRYWFWQERTQRLMMVATSMPHEGASVTLAVGDVNVMDALGMSPDAAKNDQSQAEKSIVERLLNNAER